LDEDIGAGKELKSFQGGSLRTQNTLTTLDESFLVANLAADLDDIACASVFEDFEGLAIRRCQSRANHARDAMALTCCTGTLLESNLIRSRAFRIAAGSKVFRVVLTVMLPSTKSRVHAIPSFSNALVTTGHASFK
jgi:hypothetical protein